MKLFGEYLVEKKLITGDVLAHALVEQLKALPSTAEVVFGKKLLTTDQFLSVFRQQIESKSGFVEAALQLKIWNADLGAKVEEYLSSVRTPLGQVLVMAGSLSLEQITHALDDFLSEVELPKPASVAAAAPAAHVAPPVTTQAAPPAAAATGDFSPLCDLFTPALKSQLETLFMGDSKALASPDVIRQLKDEVHRLKGSARLVSAVEIEKLLESLESLFALLQGLKAENVKPELLERVRASHQRSIGLLWQSQQELRAAPAEGQGSAAVIKELQHADEQIQLLCFDLGFAS